MSETPKMTYEKMTLPNGVRVLVEPNHSVRSVALGITCRTGSRHELPGEEGITHFIEHMLFKGTPTRNAKDIAETIEGRGGMLNAFTDKEMTTYYCRILSADLEVAIDVLTDMVKNSLLDSEELNREKGVVIEEISRSEDEPSDQVHDLHCSTRWGVHPLGKPIIGTKDSVSSFNRDDLVQYIGRRYRGNNLVVSVAGDCDSSVVQKLVQDRFAEIPAGGDSPNLDVPAVAVNNLINRKDIEQVHFCIGGDGVSIYDPRYHTVAILDGILGAGMSSRLFQEVRERRGLAYAIGSYHLSYTAGGMFTIYGGTGLNTWPEVQEVVTKELQKVIHEGLVNGEIEKIKRQIAGNIVLSLEGMSSRMLRMTRNEIFHDREITVDETLTKINAVTAQDVVNCAAELLSPERLSITAIVPNGA